MTLENLEIIGSSTCPYVQRVVSLLIETKTPFTYKNVDLKNKPEWFLEKSPLGKVPVLRFPDGQYIFESVIINEFIDSVLPQDKHLSPSDPLLRAQNKAWIEFLGSIFLDVIGAIQKLTKAEVEAAIPTISKKFAALEHQIVGPFFNGNKISLIDIAAGPLLQRGLALEKLVGIDLGERSKYPKVAAWVKTVTEYPNIIKAAALQAEDPALSTPSNPESIAAHHVDTEPVLASFVQNWKEIVETRFPTSYAASL